MKRVSFKPLEKIVIKKPVDRLNFISSYCKKKRVLDIGCYDETAINLKKDYGHWLHGLILKKAEFLIGIDSSDLIKDRIKTGKNSFILKLDLYKLNKEFASKYKFDVVVAGELIEHIPDVTKFFTLIKKFYKNKTLLLSTPNSTSLMNVFLALFSRESSHKDHIHVFSYKTLTSLCLQSGFRNFEIIPYHVKFSEMRFKSGKLVNLIVLIAEKVINFGEWLFPLMSGGYIVKIKI